MRAYVQSASRWLADSVERAGKYALAMSVALDVSRVAAMLNTKEGGMFIYLCTAMFTCGFILGGNWNSEHYESRRFKLLALSVSVGAIWPVTWALIIRKVMK